MSGLVLIADDDPDIVKFIEVNLRLEGFDLAVAENGEQALDKARDERPDLVLLDVMMPRMDGFEVCRQLRTDPRTQNISIIMLTAKSLSADKVVGLTAGADDYIIKPFDPMELVARVKSTLRRSREMRDVNPLTGLPGNTAILHHLDRAITSGAGFALLHIDLDNFKAFNDHYGFMRGDEAIKVTAKVIQDAISAQQLDRDAFLGHIGGDDFAVVCIPQSAETLAQEIIARFDAAVPSLYDQDDREKGHITVRDRRDEVQNYPLITISIGIASNQNKAISSHLQISEIASEMKQYSKRHGASHYSVDRRRDDGS